MIKYRRMRWYGHVACMGEMRNAYKIMVEKPEAKRLLERPTHRLEDIIKRGLKEMGVRVAWFPLAQDSDWWLARVNTVVNLSVP
jgi:hypothetical protein